jgi:hypothetical protein
MVGAALGAREGAGVVGTRLGATDGAELKSRLGVTDGASVGDSDKANWPAQEPAII